MLHSSDHGVRIVDWVFLMKRWEGVPTQQQEPQPLQQQEPQPLQQQEPQQEAAVHPFAGSLMDLLHSPLPPQQVLPDEIDTWLDLRPEDDLLAEFDGTDVPVDAVLQQQQPALALPMQQQQQQPVLALPVQQQQQPALALPMQQQDDWNRWRIDYLTDEVRRSHQDIDELVNTVRVLSARLSRYEQPQRERDIVGDCGDEDLRSLLDMEL